jgi:hypothetical protein
METIVVIDSKKRTGTASANSYIVGLPVPLVGVYGAELLSATFSRFSQDHYAILDIDELRNDQVMAVSNIAATAASSANSYITVTPDTISRSFGIIPVGDYTVGSNVVYAPSKFYTIDKTFKNPMNITKFTVRWLDQSGVSPSALVNNTVLLKIKHLK